MMAESELVSGGGHAWGGRTLEPTNYGELVHAQNNRTGSVPCDREGVFGGPRSGPPSAPARGLLLQRVVVRGW